MASLNGAIGAVMGEGYLTKYLDMLSVDLSAKVIPFWRPPKTVDQIKCAVIHFDIKSGVAASQAFMFNSRFRVSDNWVSKLRPINSRPEFNRLRNPRFLGIKRDGPSHKNCG